MTDEQHNRYVAYSFLAYAGFQGFWLLMMVLWFTFVFGSIPGEPDMPFPFFGLIFGFMFVFFSIFTIPSVIAGWAMLKRKPWARTAGIVAAVLAATSAPIGTAACVYSMWFWFSDKWKTVYADQPASDHSILGLQPAGNFRAAEEDFSRTSDWMKQPPDWR